MAKEKEVRKITLGLILSWIFGIIWLFAGFIYLVGGSFIWGLVYLVMAMVIFQPANKILKEKWNIELSRSIKITVIIVGIIILMYTGDVDKLILQSQTPQQEIPAQQITAPVVKQIEPESWYEVVSFTGSNARKTDSFKINSEKWRYTVSCSSGSGFNLQLFDVEDSSGRDVDRILLGQCGSAEPNYVYSGLGEVLHKKYTNFFHTTMCLIVGRN